MSRLRIGQLNMVFAPEARGVATKGVIVGFGINAGVVTGTSVNERLQ